ncbi:MAG: MATE family efflux transporter [Clostridia bacterium]|nr:MATE family efflux transporter [Clostridia bacterium]MBQ4619165.1 MATE family efflux transporter [Clostridia bacterium]
MARTHNLNMTSGNTARLLIVFAIPMLIGNLFQQAYSFADSVIVGRFLGSDALGSVGVTGPVTFLFFSICNGIGSGAGIVTSQYYGAGHFDRTKRAIANAAYIMFIASVVMGALAFICAPVILGFMDTPERILPDAITYMRVSCIGVPLVAVYNYSSSMLRSLGDSKTPLYFLIFSCFLNIALDLLFVCVFDLRVFGAALATIIAQLISGAGCFLYALKYNPYFHLTKTDMQYDREIVRQSVRLGLPLALQWSLIAVSSTALQRFVNSFGPDAVSAFTATNRVEQLLHMLYGSVSSALATYAGQNFGAHNMERVKSGLKYGMVISALFTVVMMVAYQLLSGPIMRMFVKEEPVILIGAQALKLTSWFYIFLAVIYMCRGILNGVGDAVFAFINGIVEVVCRIGMPLLLVALIAEPDVLLIWWTAGITWAISAAFCMLRFVLWKKKADFSKSVV